MLDPFGWVFSQSMDYLRPYKNQVEADNKGHPIKFMLVFRPFRTIEIHWKPFEPYWRFWDHFFTL